MPGTTPSGLKHTAKRLLDGALRPGLTRHSVAWFLGALVMLLITSPFIDGLEQGLLIEGLLLSLVLVSALLAVGGRKRTLITAAALLVPVLTVQWVRHFNPDLLPALLQPASAMVFVLFVTLCLLRYILAASKIDSEVLCAGVSVYLMIALLWAVIYTLVARISPGSFQFSFGSEAQKEMRGFVALYFSLTTLSTVGFGDVVPVSNVARMLAMAEAVVGVFYLTLMVSRLVSLYSPGRGAAGTGG